MGNICYISSVIQAIVHFPNFSHLEENLSQACGYFDPNMEKDFDNKLKLIIGSRSTNLDQLPEEFMEGEMLLIRKSLSEKDATFLNLQLVKKFLNIAKGLRGKLGDIIEDEIILQFKEVLFLIKNSFKENLFSCHLEFLETLFGAFFIAFDCKNNLFYSFFYHFFEHSFLFDFSAGQIGPVH